MCSNPILYTQRVMLWKGTPPFMINRRVNVPCDRKMLVGLQYIYTEYMHVHKYSSKLILLLLLLLEHRGAIRIDNLAYLLLVLFLASVLITCASLPWAGIVRLSVLYIVPRAVWPAV